MPDALRKRKKCALQRPGRCLPQNVRNATGENHMNPQNGLRISGISTGCSGQDIPSGRMNYQLRNGWISAYSEMKWEGWKGLALNKYIDK